MGSRIELSIYGSDSYGFRIDAAGALQVFVSVGLDQRPVGARTQRSFIPSKPLRQLGVRLASGLDQAGNVVASERKRWACNPLPLI